MSKQKISRKTAKRKPKSANKVKPAKSDPEDAPELSVEHLPLTHDRSFAETFKTKRLARGFLRRMLPGILLDRLDLDGLTVEP